MKYISYIISVLVLIISFLALGEYMANHTYYFSMLETLNNWAIVISALIIGFLFTYYLFYTKKTSWLKVIAIFFGAFVIFSLILGALKGGILGPGIFILPINYFIIFLFYGIILLSSLAIGNLILKKIRFNKSIYDFSIKFGLGFAVLSVILYYLTALGLLNIYISYFVFFILIGILYLQKSYLKNIGYSLLKDFYFFREKILSNNVLKYLYFIIFSLIFFYVFIGFNYTFIPYPTAWDANHAYMFIPKVLAEYGGYPWNTDFRPSLTIWSAILSWVYNLGFWTWFAPDTWMITFNFISGVLTLFFGFMLIRTIVNILINDEKKALIVDALGYILIIAWLTSGMGAFLVFVDNKTDLAVLMYVILALFLLIYTLLRFKQDNDKNKFYDLVFLALSGFFFAIANLIKPTATFDFFEGVLAYSLANIGVFIVIGAILFVVGVLAYLKFRGFDKAINPAYSLYLTIAGVLIAFVDIIKGFIKYKIKIFGIFTLVGSFILTLILTKGGFGLVQLVYGEKLNTNPTKVLEGIVMGFGIPSIRENKLTGDLYSGMKQVIGSSYNEDNTRYVGYGNRDFGQVWWRFLVPSKYVKTYCIVFQDSQNCKNYEKISVKEKSKLIDKILNEYSLRIYNNIDENLIDEFVSKTIKDAEKSGKLNELIKQSGLDTNIPSWKLKKELSQIIKENIERQILQQIKTNLKTGRLDINYFNPALNNEKNVKILNSLKNGIIYENVSIPYRKLIPFNVTFNRSLQNLSSYYTDIGIVWLLLAVLMIISIFLGIIFVVVSFIKKNNELFYKAKLLFAFSFASIVGWTIWLFVAEGIVWYNIGGIIWLIITTIFLTSVLKQRYVLIYTLLFISFISIGLNLIRIASQGGGQIQTWYRSSAGKEINYYVSNGSIMPKQEIKIPYTFDDIFSLQFNMYKKPIKAFNERKSNEAGIIGGTYIKYFIKNQNKIIDDQFLMYLWQLGSDNDINKFYARLKDQGVKEIVLDPNIASVVMGTGNIALWYRYFAIMDKDGSLKEKGVFANFVDLAQSGHLEYGYTNNLGIKYALIYKDEELSKLLGVDKEKSRKLKYYMMVLRFLPRMWSFQYPDSKLGQEIYVEGLNALGKLLTIRLQKAIKGGNPEEFLSDLADIMGLNLYDYSKILQKGQANFNKLSKEEKILFLKFLSIYNQLSQNPNSLKQIVQELLKQSLTSRAQLIWVRIK